MPFLIDFILDYKEPLINRERRVKELFKSFEDEGENEENEESEEDIDEEDEESEESETPKKSAKNDKRAEKVIESFKALEKAKKEWLKTANKQDKVESDDTTSKMTLAFKKKILKKN